MPSGRGRNSLVRQMGTPVDENGYKSMTGHGSRRAACVEFQLSSIRFCSSLARSRLSILLHHLCLGPHPRAHEDKVGPVFFPVSLQVIFAAELDSSSGGPLYALVCDVAGFAELGAHTTIFSTSGSTWTSSLYVLWSSRVSILNDLFHPRSDEDL